MRPSAPSWGWAYAAGGAPREVGRCGTARAARSPGGINADVFAGAWEGRERRSPPGKMHPIRPTGPALGA